MTSSAIAERAFSRLLTGKARFVDNVHLDRMLTGVFVRSSRAHAEIVSIDPAPALSQGALLVLTGEDLPFADRDYVVRYWHPSIRGRPPSLLARGRVRYVGEPVAFLVARDRYEAEDLAALVAIDYRDLPAVGSVAAAVEPDAPQLHPEWIGNVAAAFAHEQGDMPAAMLSSPRRLKRTFSFARQAPLPLETRGCVADFDPASESLTIWVSTQTHYNVRQNLASFLDLPEYNIRVVAADVGGGFGSKSRIYPEEIIVSHASRLLQRPVKWIEDRFENLQATTHSRAIDVEIEIGYDDQGRIQALQENITLDIGAYVFTSGIITAEVASGQLSGPYKIANIQSRVECIGTNKTPIGTYRGAGQPESAFPLECMLDLIAKDVGIPAPEVRQRNLVQPADMPYVPGTAKAGTKIRLDSGDYPAMLRRAVANSGYSEVVDTLPTGERAAWGLACGLETAGLVSGESASIRIDSGGRVTLRSGMSTQGQGHATIYAQLCAETLGVDPDRIYVQLGDTDLLPFGRGAFGTRGTVIGGNAVAGAAARLRAKILAHAATLLQCDAATLTISDGVICRTGGDQAGLTLGDIARSVAPGGPLFSGEPSLEQEFVYSKPDSMTFSFGVQVARVAVDLRTGFLRILDYYVIHDAGRILNAALIDGQLIGGTADGIGGATLSELRYGEDGQLLTGSLADYLVITATELPRIRIDHFETPATSNPLGVRGVGEGGVIAAAPAIANAVARIVAPASAQAAAGLLSIPLRPEAILRACAEVRSRR
jgi:carbon-monoxide dehydrogenase large subunit